jgi:hypothetical protein
MLSARLSTFIGKAEVYLVEVRGSCVFIRPYGLSRLTYNVTTRTRLFSVGAIFSLPFNSSSILSQHHYFASRRLRSLLVFLRSAVCDEQHPFMRLLLGRRGLPIDVVTCGWSVVVCVLFADWCVGA